MGDVSTGDGKNKRYKKKYSIVIREYANMALSEPELRVYEMLFNQIKDEQNLTSPADLMMLDLAVFDFIRAKRLHRWIRDKGDMLESEYVNKNGEKYTKSKANEASYLLNAVESQFRQNMKELLITRKEQTKKALLMGDKDFASWISKSPIINVEENE